MNLSPPPPFYTSPIFFRLKQIVRIFYSCALCRGTAGTPLGTALILVVQEINENGGHHDHHPSPLSSPPPNSCAIVYDYKYRFLV